MSLLTDRVGAAPFVFVVGKGGVGKTTAAGALALDLADSGIPVHLISTDPAHSTGDLFGQRLSGDVVTSACSDNLTLEEFDAARYADAWLARALGPVTQIVEGGTYLDGDDVVAFSRLALPGIDELMAVLRLVDIAREGRRVVVDTAPTGHTLRLLDAAATHEGIADALRAMADKAAAVAGSMLGRAVRMEGEAVIEELRGYVDDYRARVLKPAAFVVVTRAGGPVAAETERLANALRERGLSIAAGVATGEPAVEPGAGVATSEPAVEPGAGVATSESAAVGGAEPGESAAVPGAPASLWVPYLDGLTGCDGLRRWNAALRAAVDSPPTEAATPSPTATGEAGAMPWLRAHARRVLLFAGKGGVGKSTCAAAAALALAGDRDVLLCSADPAGSLDDILAGAEVPRLRVLQIQPEARLARLRDAYREDVLGALGRLGLSQGAALDRRVIDALWQLTPPGLDELAALADMLDAAESHETVVLDAAPTGHFLRLLETPAVALAWTHQLMRVIVKYGLAGTTGGASEGLLQLAREL
ncbi:MAG TPA: ArsA-related P-loop ATPase, partial [Patescibacteria group bacterium]|nr:ArsA-related P-loop ATPase [Patescibacteria group bacterium]